MTHLAKAFLWLFVFVVPWGNMCVLEDLGHIARVVGIVAGVVGVVAALLRGRIRHHPFLLAGLLFVMWAWISLVWSLDPQSTIWHAFVYSQLWFMAWLIYQFADWAYLNSLLRAYVLGAWIPVMGTFLAYFQGIEAAYQRYAAPGFDPNVLSIYLSLAIPLAVYLGLRAKSSMARAFYFAYVPFALAAVFLTASRAGALAVAVAFLFVLESLGTMRLRWRIAALALLGVGISWVLTQVPPESYARIATTWSEIREGTLNLRTVIWDAGLRVFADHFVLGVGAGTFGSAVEPLLGMRVASHNTFLAVAVEGGMIGLVLWLLFMGLAFAGVLRMPSPERQLWLVIWLVLLLAFMSLNFDLSRGSWLVMTLSVGFGVALLKGAKAEDGYAR